MSRSVSAPSLVTKTSPCWNGFIVPGIHVEVGVQLLHRDAQSARLQQVAQAGGGEPLAEGGGDASSDEYVLGRRPALHGLRSYPRGTGPSAPDAPNAPPGVVSERCEGEDRRDPAGGGVDAVERRHRGGGRVGAESAELALRRRRRWRPPTTTPVRLDGEPLGEPGEDRVGALVAGVRAQHDQHQRRALRDLAGLGHQAGAGDGVDDGAGLAVDVLAVGFLRRDGEAEQLADPVVRRRLGGDVALGLLGQQLAAERVDQRLLAGVDDVVGQVVACA